MIRKISTVLICLTVIFMGTSFPTVKLAAATEQVTINVDLLNVRSGPGLTYSIVAKVKQGQTYNVTEKKNDWVKIKLSSSSYGWVAGWLVSTKTVTPTASTPSVTANSSTVTSNATGLRFRSGPGTSFSIIGVFDKGKTATYVEKSGEWVKISYSGKQGWVSSQYVTLKTTSTQSPSNSSTSSTGTAKATVTATSLNVRSTGSTSGKVIGSLKKNETVTIVKEQGKWAEIQKTGLKGWAHLDYLKKSSTSSSTSTPTEVPKETTTQVTGTITATSLNIRDSGSLSGKVIGAVLKGSKVTILEEKNDWYKISFGSNKVGWAAGWYISKSSTTATPTKPESTPSTNKQVKIIYNGTNIRSGASTSHSIVKRANTGDTFEIVGTSGDWYKINIGSSQTAYIAGWVVETIGVQTPVTKPGSEQYVKNKTIVIDPGHGGQDGGAVGTRGTLEKNLTLTTAKLLYDKLKSAGANVFLTRSNDTYISLNSRVSTSHYRNAEAFLSLHYDSTTDRSASGTTSYYYNALKDAPLASKINTEMVKQTKLRDRGIKFGNFHVMRENRVPAVLLELGFVSNPTEELSVNTSSYQERASQGIYNGLAQYFK
ncbi:SH3 domain-containing protein [Bacillus weihaiensis]|uniref:SH3 domain-containing protein n=1 Tax=Bacillus weihaiensis TaxID=1547283 RepID=UPI002352F541|nr:SH3 domain-containing protein [Bacillus weihaiensis]